jgi:hypothetical protein
MGMKSVTDHNWFSRIAISGAGLVLVYLLSFRPYLQFYGGGRISALYRPAVAVICSPVGGPYRIYMGQRGHLILFESNMEYFDRFPAARPPEVSPEVISQLRARIQLLNAGMAPPEVFQALGLSSYPVWQSDGPQGDYRFHYRLGTNCCMTLRYDMLRRPPAFLSAFIAE